MKKAVILQADFPIDGVTKKAFIKCSYDFHKPLFLALSLSRFNVQD